MRHERDGAAVVLASFCIEPTNSLEIFASFCSGGAASFSKNMSSTSARTHDAVQSIIPLVQPRLKQSIQKNDIGPSPLSSQDDNEQVVCQVCQACESRYTCPRCQLPYCSVACYKQHNGDNNACTEAFYKDRVSTVLQYEAKEQSTSMQEILSRLNPSHAASEVYDDDENGVAEEDLFRLAEALDSGTMADEDMDRLLTPEMRLAFERAVKSGALNEMILVPWHPWWMPELVSSGEELPVKSSPSMTLDDRLLKVPVFQTFRSGPLPDLTYNVVDLLYSIALTLRLHHGVDNAISLCRDSCQTLIGSSAVLRDDALHASVAEALMACTSSMPATQHESSTSTHWTVLAQDVISLCSLPRHVSHALMDAIDILKAASKSLKNEGSVEDAARMRRIRKKLEYYLSWSREATLPTELENEIVLWIEEWKGLSEAESDTILLPKPNEQAAASRRSADMKDETSGVSPLMTEVSSSRKIGCK